MSVPELLRSRGKVAAAAAAVLLLASPASAISIGQLDDFEDGTTQNWISGGPNPNPPVWVSTGGPSGAGDAYLRIDGNGIFGAGGNLVGFNDAQWTGDYLAAGVSAIQADMRNVGDSGLGIRLLLEGPGGSWRSVDAQPLAVGGSWQQVSFSLEANALAGGFDLDATLANVTRLRILHAPDFDVEPVLGSLGVDNVLAIPEPGGLLAFGVLLLATLRRQRFSR